ncbi:receptor-like protein eix2 [Quercus suber]|uniref:Receptor-like protein eix2 n=1 Tax=Quercus suber TaxID=58331 RepID=A0AAW0LGI0_QUESU
MTYLELYHNTPIILLPWLRKTTLPLASLKYSYSWRQKIINLSSNKLIGKLPSKILSILDLISLNESRNNLIGEISQVIGQLKMLESLDLSRN